MAANASCVSASRLVDMPRHYKGGEPRTNGQEMRFHPVISFFALTANRPRPGGKRELDTPCEKCVSAPDGIEGHPQLAIHAEKGRKATFVCGSCGIQWIRTYE